MKRRRKKQLMPSNEEAEDFLAKTPSFVILCDAGYAMRITFEQFEKCMADARLHDPSLISMIRIGGRFGFGPFALPIVSRKLEILPRAW